MKTRKTILFFGIMTMIPVLLTTFCLAADNTLPKKHYAIKAQNLRSALEAYQDQSGQNIAYSDVLVDGKVSNAINETCDSLQAITTILKNTGLGFKATEHGTLVLIQDAAASKSNTYRSDIQTWNHKNHSNLKMPRMSMDGMVVTATKTPIMTKEVPASIGVVTADDLKLKTRTDNFFDAIRNVPGVITDKTSSMGWGSLKVRGENPTILINGRDVKHFAETYSLDTNLMGMGAVERIEVLKGPQSAMYGGKAIAGTINIITKKGDKDQPYAEVNTLYGSGKELTGGIMFSGGKDKLSYFVNVYGATKSEWNTPKGKIPFVERDQQNLYARFDYDFLPEHTLSLEYMYNDARYKNGGKGFQHEKMGNYYKKIWDIQPARLHAAYLTYEGNIKDNCSLYATIGIGENNMDYQYGYNGFNEETPLEDYLSAANLSLMENDFVYGDVRGSMNLFPGNQLNLLAGIQYKYTDLDWTTRYKGGPGFSIFETETYLAPYAQMEYKPFDYALLVASIRHDNYSHEKGADWSSTNPRFAISLFPFAHTNYNWTNLWGSYSKAFNPPTAYKCHSPASWGGNPDLKPETTKGLEFGIKQRLGSWASLETSYFDVDYENMITKMKTPTSAERGTYYNVNKASLKGWELMCEVYPLDWLILHFGYTDLERKNESSGKKLTGQPNKIIQYGLTLTDLHGFSGSIWGRQYSDYKNYNFNKKAMGENYISEDKIIWDMKILYHWDIKEGLICEPFVAVHNLTNETYYETSVCNLMEERTYQAGISFKMDF